MDLTTNFIFNELKISSHLPSLSQFIDNNSITAIISPLGMGTNIVVPIMLAKMGYKTFVVTRIELILSQYQMIVNKNNKIGYANHQNINYDETSQIVYVTADYMKDLLLNYVKNNKIILPDVLMLDDSNLDSINNYLIIQLWNQLNQQIPKLIISTDHLNQSQFQIAQIYEIANPPISTNIRYHQRNYNLHEIQLFRDTANVIADLHTSSIDGNFIVLVADNSEIDLVMSYLNLTNIQLIPIATSLTANELISLYNHSTDQRKIIITTDIISYLPSVDNIRVIIDTMRYNTLETTLTGGLRTKTRFINKVLASQHASLASICYRMCTYDFYQRLDNLTSPQILSLPLYNTILQLLNANLDPITILNILPPDTLNQQLSLLKQLKIITDNNTITELGKFSLLMPLSIRNTTVLFNLINSNIQPLFPSICILSLIDCYGPSYFFYPQRSLNQNNAEYELIIQEHRNKFFTKFEGRSDLHTLVNIFTTLLNDTGGLQAPTNELLLWCRSNSINYSKINEVISLILSIINILSTLNIFVEIGPFNTIPAIDLIRPVIQEVYSNLIMYLYQQTPTVFTYYHTETSSHYRLDFKQNISLLISQPSPSIIALISSNIQTAGPALNLVTLALDLNLTPPPSIVYPSIPFEQSLALIQRSGTQTQSQLTPDEVLNFNLVLNMLKNIAIS